MDISKMSEKEIALKIAKNYGMEWEVVTWYEKYIEDGIEEDTAWDYALMEWDLYPFTKKQLNNMLSYMEKNNLNTPQKVVDRVCPNCLNGNYISMKNNRCELCGQKIFFNTERND